MEDDFLYQGRREPPAEFARKLRVSLDSMSANEATSAGSRTPAARWAAATLAILLVGSAFTVPAVRAGARAFLDLFRVVNFAAIPIDGNHIQQLGNTLNKLDLPAVIGKQVEILKKPGPGQTVATQEAASAAAGVRVRLPTWIPVGFEHEDFQISDESAVRMTADTAKLRTVLDTLGIDDIDIPDEIDGQSATIRLLPVVHTRYRRKAEIVEFIQARRPEVSFPAGLDLASLAEVALRVLGVDSAEAHRFAMNVDWRTTLVVPVPTQVASFRQVNVQGNSGLLIESVPERNRREHTRNTLLLWSSGDSVFSLGGTVQGSTLFEMAQSLQQ
jgi:hypothetical protein